MFEARTDGERAFSTPAMTADAPAEVVIIRAGGSYDGKQGMSLATGVSSRSAGARGLCLHLVTIPPGTRGVPHVHDGHESAIYTISGETEVWHGEGLRHRAVVTVGDFLYRRVRDSGTSRGRVHADLVVIPLHTRRSWRSCRDQPAIRGRGARRGSPTRVISRTCSFPRDPTG